MARVRAVADEVRETLAAESHLIDNAVSQHSAFRDGSGPAGGLERALIKYGAARGASVAGIWPERVAGGLDLVSQDGVVVRRYRLKSARRRRDGSPDVVCGAGSTLLKPPGDSLFREERWILGFVTSDDHLIEEMFAAQIVGHHGENPVHLDLGPIVDLNGTPAPLGFTSTDEGLDGFDDEDRDDQEDTDTA